MTLSIDGTNIGEIIEIASIVASVVATALVALIAYLMVRPPRHVREQRRVERDDPIGDEELRLAIDRMEARIETLERLLAEQDERPALRCREQQQLLTPAGDGLETRRK